MDRWERMRRHWSVLTGVDPVDEPPAVGPAALTGLVATEWDWLTLEFVRHRIDDLAVELARLDDDPDVFAKAFRIMVARSAYEALVADAARIEALPRPTGVLDLGLALALDLDLDPVRLADGSSRRREVLDV